MFAILLLAVLCQCSVGIQKYDAKANTIVDVSYDDRANMIVVGDWGGIPVYPFYRLFEKATANQMIKTAANQQTEFILALGDNFYFDGVKNEYDSRFQTTFEKVFDGPSFNHIPWYVLAGNHDHNGNVTGQIDYSKHSQRWVFPNFWYAIQVRRPTFNITIVMIDTVLLCGNTRHDQDSSQPNGNISHDVVSDQLSFIESVIRSNKDRYVMVAGHFPVWSVATAGPTRCLLEKLKPMLEKYGVNAYLCGHEHDLQHLQDSSVDYFVSGAANFIDPFHLHKNSVPADALKFCWGSHFGLGGFATIQATNQSMELTFISATGENLYQHTILPRK